MLIRRFLMLAAAVLLSGCANLWRVNNEVESFSRWSGSVPSPVRFRFERLPSQQNDAAAQTQLEQLALPALNQAGLVVDDAAPAYSLQVGSYLQETTRWDDPELSPFYFSPWIGGRGRGYGYGYGMRFGAPLAAQIPRSFQRQFSLVLRDLATGTVVFESRAAYDARNWIGLDVVPAMATAALLGFPNPPAGVRQVSIELPH